MRNILFFIALFIGIVSINGCVSDVKKDTAPVTKPAKGADADAKKAWREKVKAAQANKANAKGNKARKAKAAAGARNRGAKASAKNKALIAKYKQPVEPEKNKGVFISEAQQYLTLTPAKTSELEQIIKKYKRKGLDFKFFGGFYSDTKPFARDLAKIFTPVQVEKFKHFHAFWFDRIPYPRADMPVSLYYRLNLTKEQFISVMDIYSRTTLAKKKGGPAVIAKGISQIQALLTPKQKAIYKEILSISSDKF